MKTQTFIILNQEITTKEEHLAFTCVKHTGSYEPIYVNLEEIAYFKDHLVVLKSGDSLDNIKENAKKIAKIIQEVNVLLNKKGK